MTPEEFSITYTCTPTTTYGANEMETVKLTQREIKAVRKAAKKNHDVADALDKILDVVKFEYDPFGSNWDD